MSAENGMIHTITFTDEELNSVMRAMELDKNSPNRELWKTHSFDSAFEKISDTFEEAIDFELASLPDGYFRDE